MQGIFGLRDFYHLNKDICNDFLILENPDEIKQYTIIRKNIKKNFSGFTEEYQNLWEKFCGYMGKPEKIIEIPEPSVLELIRTNLKDRNGRYLMIVTENDGITDFIENMLAKEESMADYKSQKLRKIVGSSLPEDVKDTYLYRILSDVILYLEQGYTLIFEKMDNIYCSLYDLFNQNFSFSGDNKYCKISLGALYNAKCLVNPDFHCIIFLNEKDLPKTDYPFLNRFEKYNIKLDDILNNNEMK